MKRTQYQELQNKLGCVGILLSGQEPRVKQALADLLEAQKYLEDIWVHRPEKTGKGRNTIISR